MKIQDDMEIRIFQTVGKIRLQNCSWFDCKLETIQNMHVFIQNIS